MKYIRATEKNLEQVVSIVQETISKVYPKYYPREVVDFFCEHHCRESIRKDMEEGYVRILVEGDRIVGTGCHKDNHITRVYVLPEYQGQGYGSYIMQCLEGEIRDRYADVYVDASLPACQMYEKRGYTTVRHEKWEVANDVKLVYEVMKKDLSR